MLQTMKYETGCEQIHVDVKLEPIDQALIEI